MEGSEPINLKLDTLKVIFRCLDNLKYELEARVYTLDEDEMSWVFYCRDLAELAIRRHKEDEK